MARSTHRSGTWLRPRGYELTPIAENGQTFRDFTPYVAAINDRGIVAFQASLRAGGSGVYLSDGGPAVAVPATTSSPIREICSHPDIDAGGSVCCYADLETGERAVIVTREGDMRIVAEDAGPLGPTMNEGGIVAFRTGAEGGATEIFAGRDDDVTRIAGSDEQFAAFQGLPVINDNGVVVFRADLRAGGHGIYASSGGELGSVAETGPVFEALGEFPVVSDTGSVAFCARFLDGRSGVLVASGGATETVIDTTDGFESFRGVLFAEEGGLIFYGTPRGGELGVFSGPDHERDRILGVGSAFIDSAIAEFALNPVSINRVGQIAVRVKLANGNQYIVRADPTG